MVNRFLQREVKQDGKDIYIHYGSIRLRPHNPKKSNFKEGQLVAMTGEDLFRNPTRVKVFVEIPEYEIWKSRVRV